MYIARWTVTVQNGQLDAYLALLRRWQVDVGMRAGWRAENVRLATGALGPSANVVQYDIPIDELNDLQLAWNDIAKNSAQAEYAKGFDALVVPGSTRWEVLQRRELRFD